MRPRRRRVTYEDQQEICGKKASLGKENVNSESGSVESHCRIQFQQEVDYKMELGPHKQLRKLELVEINEGPSEQETKKAFKKKKKYSVSEWEEGQMCTVVLT